MRGLRERAVAGALSGLLTIGLGWALLLGLGVGGPKLSDPALLTFDVPPPPPARERVAPPPLRSEQPEGRAAPPNIRSETTAAAVPVPVVVPPVAPVMVVAPVARTGLDATAGAAERAGPGQGAGGEGDGFGGGGSDDRDGGGEESPEWPPVPRRGKLDMGVLPAALRERNGEYSVELRYHVEVDGRATGCRAARSSGWAELDANACREVERRFRYRPALDGRRTPVRSVLLGTHSWFVTGEPDAARRR